MISLVPLLVMLLGLILFYRTSPPADPRTSTIGLHCFWVGLLVLLLQLAPLIAAIGGLYIRG
jgi:hypothetical protein